MRLSIFVIIFLCIQTQQGQTQVIQLGLTQYANRFDYSYVQGFAGWLEPVQRDFTRSSQGMTLDILIHKGFYFNTGYLRQFTSTGFLVRHPDGAAAGAGIASLWHTQIPLRIKYQQKLFTKWDRSLWISATAGIAYNINNGYNDPWQNGSRGVKSLPASETRTMYYYYTFNSSFNKNFILYRGDLEFGVDLMPWAAVFFRIGGSIGTQTQAQHDIDYWFDDTGLLKGTMINEGDAWYYGVGIYGKLFPQQNTWKGAFQKLKKKKHKEE